MPCSFILVLRFPWTKLNIPELAAQSCALSSYDAPAAEPSFILIDLRLICGLLSSTPSPAPGGSLVSLVAHIPLSSPHTCLAALVSAVLLTGGSSYVQTQRPSRSDWHPLHRFTTGSSHLGLLQRLPTLTTCQAARHTMPSPHNTPSHDIRSCHPFFESLFPPRVVSLSE